MSGTSRPQFVLFGSSIVQFGFYGEGWVANLAHVYARKADIINRGYSGWNTRRALQVVEKVFPKDARVQPSLVIVYFGGNDSSFPDPSGFGTGVPLEEYVENLKKIINHIKSLSETTRIIVLSTPPINDEVLNRQFARSNGKPSRTNETCQVYSEACLDLCEDMNIKAIDMWTTLQKVDKWQDACFIDGIHLSPLGNKLVFKEIMKVLKDAEWKPSLYWKSLPSEFGEDSPYDPFFDDGRPYNNISNWILPGNEHWE
ncbi:hypothetical protein VNO80_07349 [Phaseolus coccineus]|uniref:SGNH hydrolase-type esterase domain-containing protein n=1 Tax=Phaseolus coccineus TaxID=3886 RepID=A0AAN9NNB5_PHACN